MITGLYLKSDVEIEFNLRRVTVITADIFMRPELVINLIENSRTTKTQHKWMLEFDDGQRMTHDMSILERINMRGAEGVRVMNNQTMTHPTVLYNITQMSIKSLRPDEQLIMATYDVSVWNGVRAAVKYGIIDHSETVGIFLTPQGTQEVCLDKGGLECKAPSGFFDAWELQQEELDG